MATRPSMIDFILDQLRGLPGVRARKMFGEYALYHQDKVVALVCDDQLFVKLTPAGKAFVGDDYEEGEAYPGAKPSMRIGAAELDDHERLSDLIRITADALPSAKPKRPGNPKNPQPAKPKGVSSRRVLEERVAEILDELRALGSERDRAGMARYGINVDHASGVSIYKLREVAGRLGTDHKLALALWATGNHEARLLACFVDDPAAVTAEQTESWASDFDSWDICDQATTSLFDLTPHGWAKAREWAGREEEWVRRAGFALMAGLAVHDKTATDASFRRLLPLIERAAYDERNFVKKAVNWALRNIGKRNRALNAASIASAERILAAANKRAGGERGGDARARSARWVANDALRELTSAKVRGRLKG